MNEMKSMGWRSWALRQPSAKVKEQIFSGEGVVRPEPVETQRAKLPLWSLLAPVAACMFVVMMGLKQHDTLFPTRSETYFGTTGVSNQAYMLSSSNTFDWTNKAQIPSSVRSRLIPGTN